MRYRRAGGSPQEVREAKEEVEVVAAVSIR
jgi:hypothetical protein